MLGFFRRGDFDLGIFYPSLLQYVEESFQTGYSKLLKGQVGDALEGRSLYSGWRCQFAVTLSRLEPALYTSHSVLQPTHRRVTYSGHPISGSRLPVFFFVKVRQAEPLRLRSVKRRSSSNYLRYHRKLIRHVEGREDACCRGGA